MTTTTKTSFLATLIKTITCVTLLMLTSVSWGQTATQYNFSATTGSYTALSGQTAVTTTSSTADEDYYNGIPIGFNFIMNNTVFTHAHVSTNGWITLGTSAVNNTITSPTYTNSFTSLGNSPTIAPLWDDLALSAPNGISYLTAGTAPNRTLTIQYSNVKWNYSATSVAMDFQIVLYESTNAIQFIYNSLAGSVNSGSASIGIATSSSNYLSLGTTVTTAATASTSTNTTSISTKPATGITFTFTPPPPCVAPTALAASVSSSSQTVSTISGSFTAASSAPSGYIVVRSTSAIQPTAPLASTALPSVGNTSIFGTGTYVEYINSNAGTWTSTGLNGNTTYYYYVFGYNNTSCIGGPVYSSSATSFSQSTSSCPTFSSTISIGGSTTPGSSYATLTAAIADIKACGISQPTILELSSTYTSGSETFPITLSSISGASATNTITIRPASDAVGEVITSANTTATIDINGGQFWVIDGRPGGIGSSQLTIANSSTATGGTSIRFINEGSNNIVQYTNLTASYPSTSSGVILFSTTTGSNGNDNNTIDNCNIDGGAGTTASPTLVALNGIYSSGTTTTTSTNNSGNTISNCKIYNFFGAASTSAGINLQSGSTDWAITSNSIYQTSTRTTTASSVYIYGITIAGGGNNFVVTNNFIGGSTINAGGSAWTVSGNFSNRFNGIGLSVGSTTASSVQGNTISNIIFTTTSGATSNSTSSPLGTGFWGGIMIAAGNVNLGTITGNTIGSSSGTGSIQATCQTSGGTANGIGVSGSGIVNISNNNIGSLIALGSTTSISSGIIGIQSASTGTVTISNNLIGSASTTNSINAANPITSTSNYQLVTGINNSGTGTIVISNNTISNLNNAAVPSGFITASSVIRGIVSSAGTNTITSNTIKNLSCASFATGTTSSASVIGLSFTSPTAPVLISQNVISGLKNTYSGNGATSVIGLHYNGPTAGVNVVSKNSIYGLSTLATSSGALNYGINVSGGLTSFQNNMIVVGQGNNIGIDIRGINDSVGTNNYYHNTVYIGGAPTTNAANSFAFNSAVTTNARVFQNNIFINARSNSGSTGKHYAISIAGTAANPTGLTVNNNIYLASGSGGILGLFNAVDRNSLTAWQTATGQDASSLNVDPCLANPTAATPDLHLTDCSTAGSPAESSGILIASVTDDFDGQTRSGLTPTDIGADAGNYGPSGIDMKASALIAPIAGGCKTATETVTVSITNFSTTPIDFSVNNVTVSVTTTGGYSSSVVLNSGTLASGASQNVTMPNTIDMTTSGTYIFNANTSVTGDVNNANNAISPNSIAILSLGGTYTVGTSGNYNTLTAAITAVNNTTCITAPIVLLLTDATYPTETFPITINSNTNLTSTNTLTIRPATGINPTITGSNTQAIFVLNGADNIIIDGSNNGTNSRNLTITNSNTGTSSAVIWLQSSGSNGVTNNIIKNLTVRGNSNTTTLFGIGMGASTSISTSSLGTSNNNNIFDNNSIGACQHGIYSQGVTALAKNTGNTFSNNLLNNASPNNIGITGILLGFEDNVLISSNQLGEINGTVDRAGINLGWGTSYSGGSTTGNEVTNATIANNIIGSVIGSGTNTAFGICVASASSGTTTIRNNMISGISSNGTISDISAGIALGGGTGSTTNVYHNTISMQGTITGSTAGSTASVCLAITNTTMGTIDIKNNIFNNIQSGNSGATTRFSAMGITASTLTGFTSNNNNFVSVGSGPGSYILISTGGITSGTTSTLASWQTSFSQDANSLSISPTFISATDLHLNTSSNCRLDNKGVFIATVTTDIDGATRSNSTPDMGADEFTGASVATTWTGTTNNLWSVATNWSCGVVPTATDAIAISSGNPTLDVDFTVGATGALTLSGAGTLTIAPGKTLTVAGTANFGGKLVTFKSDATGTAMFGPLTGALTGATNVLVERYIPARRAYRFVSPSVTTATSIRVNWQENGGTAAGLGTHITGTGGATNGFDVTETNNPSLLNYVAGAWTYLTNTNATTLTAGNPLCVLVRGDRTTDLTTNTPTPSNTVLRANGTLYTGNFSPAVASGASQYSFIGNPYQAPLDIKTALAASTDVNPNVVYYWDPTINVRGGYVTRNLQAGSNDVTSNNNDYVQPGQGFFVINKATLSGTPAITFTEANKSIVNAGAGVFRNATVNQFGTLRANLQIAQNNQWKTLDATMALFNDSYNWSAGDEDALKMTNLDEEISFVQDSKSLAIAGQSEALSTSELPIKFKNNRYTDYQWSFDLTNYNGLTPYLFDSLTNAYTEITNGTTVPFTVDVSNNVNRFKIVFTTSALHTDTFASQIGLYPNPSKGNGFNLQLPSATAVTVKLYNMLGQEISLTANGTYYQANQPLLTGMYHIKVTQGGQTSTLKWIVE